MNLNELTILKAHQGLKAKDFSSVELTRECFEQIKKIDPKIKAFVSTCQDKALSKAKEVDDKIARQESLLELAGIPYAAKDLYCTRGVKTSAAGSKILEEYDPAYESTTTQRLLEQNAVLIGKTNMDEFAMGSSTENSAFFATKNPHDLTRVPGGTSGGSAAAVAANECIFALGTDTGGSIRQPASFCGCVGLKPTYGRTSRYGVVAYASSLDTIGHLTKTVEDSALVLGYIAGRDKYDSTTSDVLVDNYLAEIKQDIKGLKVGIPKQYINTPGIDDQVKDLTLKSVKKIEELTGYSVQEIDMPHTEYALACYYIIMPAEASSNLARYDGIKYGLSKKSQDLLSAYLASKSAGFGAEVKRRIILGTYVLSHGYYDAYYKKAQQVRRLIRQDFQQAFEKVDVLLAPVAPTPAFKIGEKTTDPLTMYLEDIFTVPISLAGVPGLSIPVGRTHEKLPVGVQLIGKWFDEKTILKVGYNFEQSGD